MYYTLRIAMAMCFIGHGCFGIITKQVWCNYFAVFGIDNGLAYTLMPPIGIFDIAVGVLILVYPVRAAVIWLLFWGVFTALLRPMSGEPVAEFVERAGNYGAPLAMLLLTRAQGGALFTKLTPNIARDDQMMKRVSMCLRIVVFMLLAGHGWLNLIEKKALIAQYAAVGFADPAKLAVTIGVLEVGAAVAVLMRPAAWFLLVLFAWKMCSELFYPHYEIFEWIERGGSYGSILALYFATRKTAFYLKVPKITMPVAGH